MTQDNTTQDHITKQDIQEKAENFLNFQFDRTGINTEIEEENSFYHITVNVSGDESWNGTTYQLQGCPICGEIQAMNFQAFKKNNPSDAEMILEEVKEEQIEKYRDSGITPDSEERLKKKIERTLTWDNRRCEQRHPPHRDRPVYHGRTPQTNRMY